MKFEKYEKYEISVREIAKRGYKRNEVFMIGFGL